MRGRSLGTQGLTVAPIGLGCMGMSSFYGERDDARSTETIHRALDLGVTMFDTADMYGPWTNEQLLGNALAGRRSLAVIASKCGQEIDDNGVWTRRMNGSPQYIRKALDGSLRRLGVDHIDLYYLHRVDPAVPVEESFGALAELVGAGKVRWLGISEAAADTIRRAHAVTPLAAVQTEYSLFTRDVEDNGVLATCEELGIGFVAYAPLGRGFLSGTIRSRDDFSRDDIRRNSPRFQGGNFRKNLDLLSAVTELAAGKGVTTAQLALAWLLARGSSVVTIPGTRRIARLEENVAATSVDVSPEEIDALDALAPQGAVAGERYAPEFLRTVHL
ncbi:aldo/keto reductase [Streptomyces sp. NPDC051976]|uniref:aldo/keto reductase n=1 Tax=Streptomyces sp. NPDC051976 TaxID=3154947 RepID=UPI00341F12B0